MFGFDVFSDGFSFSLDGSIFALRGFFGEIRLELFLFVVLLFSLAQLAARVNSKNNGLDFRVLAFLVCVSVIVEWVIYRVAEGGLIRPSGLYLEPSHLALSATPLLVALIFSRNIRDRVFGWGALATIFALSSSATLFVLVGLSLIFVIFATGRGHAYREVMMRLFFLLSLVIGLIFVSPYREDFLARVDGVLVVDAEANISSLFYVNGWEVAARNVTDTFGVGLGFNRMGCNPRPSTEAGGILADFGLDEINFNDGSFTLAKIISEFGVLGVGVWIVLAWLLFRAVRCARSFDENQRMTVAFVVAAGVVLVLGGAIRGTNYFSGPFLLGVFCLLSSVVRHRLRGNLLRS